MKLNRIIPSTFKFSNNKIGHLHKVLTKAHILKRLFYSKSRRNGNIISKEYLAKSFKPLVENELILLKSINEFFNTLELYRKYYLLLKIQFKDGSWRTMHTGILISKNSLSKYIKYITDNIINREDYAEENCI